MSVDRVPIAILTAGRDIDYVEGLAKALSDAGERLEIVSNSALANSSAARLPGVIVHDFLGPERSSLPAKISRAAGYYWRLIAWSARTRARIFHIVWYYKLPIVERTALNGFFRLLGKRVVFTAHNIDDKARDGRSNGLQRASLKWMYSRLDHILVHTEKMRRELLDEFWISPEAVTVIPFGFNERIPAQGVSREGARRKLGLDTGDRVLLFFGNITPYKGLELLVGAFSWLVERDPTYRLVVAGAVKRTADQPYWRSVVRALVDGGCRDRAHLDIGHVPDERVETYFKAADVTILPYRGIYQSGVLVLSYRYGCPVIATDVGSLREDLLEGVTGLVCAPDNARDLARKIAAFLESRPTRDEAAESRIQAYARVRFSWRRNAELTVAVYRALKGNCESSRGE